MIDLTSKLGEINNKEHNKGSKIYPQNQVILDCIMPSIPLKHKCSSIILIWVSSNGLQKKQFFLNHVNWEKHVVLGKKVANFDWEWSKNAPRKGQKIPWTIVYFSVIFLQSKDL